MAICPKCKSECPKQAKHCPVCRVPLQVEQQTEEKTNFDKVLDSFAHALILAMESIGKLILRITTKMLTSITGSIGRFIKKHPLRFGFLIELLVLLGIVAGFICAAFAKLGEYAIPAVVLPVAFAFFGLMIFYSDYSTPEGKEKYKKRMQKVKRWLNKNGDENKIIILAAIGTLELLLAIALLVILGA